MMLGNISNALNGGGFVVCDMIGAAPPLVRVRFSNGECTALVRHALLASLWNGHNNEVVVTSSVHLIVDGKDVLVILGLRDATAADRPAELGVAIAPCAVAPCITSTDASPVMRKPTPIAELCARRGTRPDLAGAVVYKGLPIPFKNGTGEMIAFELQDESGKIRAVSFSPDCHALDARLRVGGRYRLTGGRCKKTDGRFGDTGHEFELVLDASVLVEEIHQR